MIEDRHLTLDGDLRLEFIVVLTNIRRFFSDNGIGQEQGADLVRGFLSLTFDGGSTVLDTESRVQTSDQVKVWLNQMEPVIQQEISKLPDLTKEMIFSQVPTTHQYLEMLREAFWEAIFSPQQSNAENVDGTAQVVACLLILKTLHPQTALFSSMLINRVN